MNPDLPVSEGHEPAQDDDLAGLTRRDLLLTATLVALMLPLPAMTSELPEASARGVPFDDGTWFDDGTGWVD